MAAASRANVDDNNNDDDDEYNEILIETVEYNPVSVTATDISINTNTTVSSSSSSSSSSSFQWPENSRLNQLPKLIKKAISYLTSSLSLYSNTSITITTTSGSNSNHNKSNSSNSSGGNDIMNIDPDTNYFSTKVYTDNSIYTYKSRYGAAVASVANSICTAIFSRISSLRSTSTTRVIKYRAVCDLFSLLKNEGIPSLRSTIPKRLNDIRCLILLPAPLPLETLADVANKNHTTVLRSAEDYFIRNIAEISGKCY